MRRVLILIPVCSTPLVGILPAAFVLAYPNVLDGTLVAALCLGAVALVAYGVSFAAQGRERWVARRIAAWLAGIGVALALGVVVIAVTVVLVLFSFALGCI